MNILYKIIINLFIFIVISGCAVTDFHNTTFKKLDSNNEYSIYEFKAFADVTYPENTNNGEEDRMYWLNKWLKENELDKYKYEIIKREKIKKHTGLLGDIYDIYYTIKIYNRN